MKRTIILFVFLVLTLTACDPFKAGQIEAQADADYKAAQARQYEQNQAQARQQSADLHVIEMQDANRIQERKDAIEEQVRLELTIILIFAGASAVYFIVFNTLTFTRAVQTMTTETAAAYTKFMLMRASLIYLDDKGHFPAFHDAGAHVLSDLNTGKAMPTGRQADADPQLVAESHATRRTWIIASNTRRSHENTAPSTALTGQPPHVIDVRDFFEITKKRREEDAEAIDD